MTPSPSYQLAELALREDPVVWLKRQRKAGKSWRQCAKLLRETTDGRIDLHDETLRLWATAKPKRVRKPAS